MSEASKRRDAAAPVLLLLILGIWVWAAGSAPWTGTEPRRAVIARHMAQSGDLIVPMHGGEPTLTKPPLHYQLQAAAMAWSGSATFGSRVPALLLMGCLLLAFWIAARRFGRPGNAYAWAGVLLLASHPVVGQFAASAEIDGPFAAWIAMSMLALGDAAAAKSPWRSVLLSGVLASLAVLTKGPPAYLFLVPAWIPLLGRVGWKPFAPWLVISVLPVLAWLGVLELREMLTELTGVARTETVGRLGFVTLDRVARIPLDLAKFAALLLPPLMLLVLPVRGRDPLPSERRHALRVLVWGGAGGLLLMCLFPHRATRYLLPSVAPLLFVLVHWTGPWIDYGAARLETVKRALQAALVAALPVVLWFAPGWVIVAPAAVIVGLLALGQPGLRTTFAGLGAAVLLFTATDAGRRKVLPPRDMISASRYVAAATGEELVTGWGYVPSEAVWVLGDRIRSDEYERAKTIRTPWVLLYEPRSGRAPVPPASIDVRLRVTVRKATLVLARVVE